MSEQPKKKSGEHRWKLSWPGNFCLDCGESDPLEDADALVNCACQKGCEKCKYTGTVLNSNLRNAKCPVE
jgi:hypothetical protein